ncbi:MAG: hypothetical protein QXE35_06140 [Acidilobaceae archaeon]
MGGLTGFLGGKDPLRMLSLLTLETMHRGWDLIGLTFAVSKQDRVTLIPKYYSIGSWYRFLTERLKKVSASSSVDSSIVGGIGYVGETSQILIPAVEKTGNLKLAVAIDGDVLNLEEIANRLNVSSTGSKIEVLARVLVALSRESGGDLLEAVKSFVDIAIGGFSLVAISSEPRIVIAKDARGFKPLSYAVTDSGLAVASETSALQTLRLDWRELDPGAIASFDGKDFELVKAKAKDPAPCAFEFVYISRPDSVFHGVQVYTAKFNLGRELAKIAEVKADIVTPLPDSGRIAALGYSRESGIPLEEAVYAVKYVGRSFLAPPEIRGTIADAKYGIVSSVIMNKSVVVVDDSIVRGTTMRRISRRLRATGAREIHLRISCPRFAYPCPINSEVSAHELAARAIHSFEKEIGVESLAHNSVEGLKRAIGLEKLCTACFSGECPLRGLSETPLNEIKER